jgi:hypothetical protein
MLCLIYLGANLRNGVVLCGRKFFWLRPLLVSWLVPPFPFKRPRQMPLGVAAIRPPRQGTPAITRRVGRSSAGARVNGSCTELPIGVALRRRPNHSKWQGGSAARAGPLSFSLSPRSFLPHCFKVLEQFKKAPVGLALRSWIWTGGALTRCWPSRLKSKETPADCESSPYFL